MMRASRRALVLVASIAVVMAGCKRVQPPTAELTSVRFSGIGLRGATLVADLSIDNPNQFAIETDSITFELAARDPASPGMWTPVTNGKQHEPLRIEGGGRTVVTIPAELAYANLSAPLRSVIDRGTFNYRVSGEVSLREPRRSTVPFSRTGNLSVLGGR